MLLVTQPRRISATSVAERIAWERSETIGDVVGYNIRLENEVSANSKVIFMTPGVLLRMAQEDPELCDFTHIIIDEAHERDRYTDFLFIILRDLLVLNKTEKNATTTSTSTSTRAHPKLILMSATLQTQKLSDYFGGIPNLHIGSSVHPVQQFYLEDVLRFVGFFDESAASSNKKQIGNVIIPVAKVYTCPICQSKQKFLSSEELGTHVASCFGVPSFDSSFSFAEEENSLLEEDAVNDDEEEEGQFDDDGDGEGAVEEEEEGEEDDDMYSSRPPECTITSDVSGISSSSAVGAEVSKSDEDLLRKYQVSWDDSECDYDLIENLLTYICESEYARNNDATILIFLPGWETISKLSRTLEDSPSFGNEKRFKIIPLHSGIPKNLQKEAFKPAAPGVVKIVLSTNIAETSVTIDNVTVVIDTGRAKEKSYDPHLKLSSLKENWISQSSARQRKGRAGRTRSGVCFRLYSSRRHDSLPIFQESEMLRSSLEELALMCKIMGLAPGHGDGHQADDLHSFLLRAMDPPHTLSISNAIDLLENINCLDRVTGEVTPLGYAVSQLPVDPCVGRLMIMGLMTGCGPNVIKTACAMSYRDPFVMPVNEQQKVRSKIMKKKLAGDLPSDQITILRAILQYNQVTSQQGFRGIQRFCDDNFLSRNTMSYLQSLCQSVSQNVQEASGVNPNSSYSMRNNGEYFLLNAMVGFGLYSNIAIRKKGNSIFTTEKGHKAKIHPSSLNNTNASNAISAFSSQCNKELEVIGFQDLVSLTPQKGRDSRIGGASVQMLSTSPMSVFVLLLACGNFSRQIPTTSTTSATSKQSEVAEELFVLDPNDEARGIVLGVVDNWLPIRMYQDIFQMICDIRECLNDAISCYLLHHRNHKTSNLPAHISAFNDVIAKAFIYEHSSKAAASPAALVPAGMPASSLGPGTVDQAKRSATSAAKKSSNGGYSYNKSSNNKKKTSGQGGGAK
jgi:ATP-dependent RNA helicase DHX36